MNQDPLRDALLELLRALDGDGVQLILGGGYGLYLKQRSLEESKERTLIDASFWPPPRSTQDIDLFLQTDVVASAAGMRRIRRMLDELGFIAIETARFMHFQRPLPNAGQVKIDLLTGPITDPATRSRLRMRRPRVRPREAVELHAYLTEEALAFDEAPFEVRLSGRLPDGRQHDSTVLVPQPFTFMLMKLHAFRDRAADPNRELSRHHALDLYRIVAMITEAEDESVRRLLDFHRSAAAVTEARRIVAAGFGDIQSPGVLRLREHPLFQERLELAAFLSYLRACFPAP